MDKPTIGQLQLKAIKKIVNCSDRAVLIDIIWMIVAKKGDNI